MRPYQSGPDDQNTAARILRLRGSIANYHIAESTQGRNSHRRGSRPSASTGIEDSVADQPGNATGRTQANIYFATDSAW